MIELKNMAVVGIVNKGAEQLYKVAVWDAAYLNIKYKLCTMDEVHSLAEKYVPIDSFNIEILKRKVPCVDYIELFDAMCVSWIKDVSNLMYSYFDCLRWCISNKVNVCVSGQQLDWDALEVDLKTLRVVAGDIVLFELMGYEPVAAAFDIDLSGLSEELYTEAASEFNLDGTECMFHYEPIEIVSSRNQCYRLRNYAGGHEVTGKLYAIDQILGERL